MSPTHSPEGRKPPTTPFTRRTRPTQVEPPRRRSRGLLVPGLFRRMPALLRQAAVLALLALALVLRGYASPGPLACSRRACPQHW